MANDTDSLESDSIPVREVNPAPSVFLEAFPEYLIGFPMVVAVTCWNKTEKSTFYNLPGCDLWETVSPVGFTFITDDGRKTVLPTASTSAREGPPEGFKLAPGESRRMLFDLSSLNPPSTPGTYHLIATYKLNAGASVSEPVEIELIAPEPLDSAVSLQLRGHNDVNEASWVNFIRNNWRTIYVTSPPPEKKDVVPYVDAFRLSQRAKEVLAFHFFLHRAVYGPEKVGSLSAKQVEACAKGLLESEAKLLQLEILKARNDRSAKNLQEELLTKFPGVRFRLEEIERGEGFLTTARRSRGAEREFDVKPGFYPYVEK
jgi:hypothetical protein